MSKGKYFNNDIKLFNYIIIPKLLFENKEYKKLSHLAILAYALLLNRASLSKKNEWIDKNKRVFVYYTILELSTDLSASISSIKRALKDLESTGLIKRKKQGQGLPDIIYVMNVF